jgi:hypothetical protein
MEWWLLWFVLAGFVLGFATSTLWEWLYYRGVRQRAVGSSPAPVTQASVSTTVFEPPPTAWDNADYRSPAILLEEEAREHRPIAPTPRQETP